VSWYQDHRMEWIAETLRVFGYINREHIERKFGLSTPQASADLAEFQSRHPKLMMYNKSTKRYEAVLFKEVQFDNVKDMLRDLRT
jgi:hypothetical protein